MLNKALACRSVKLWTAARWLCRSKLLVDTARDCGNWYTKALRDILELPASVIA